MQLREQVEMRCNDMLLIYDSNYPQASILILGSLKLFF